MVLRMDSLVMQSVVCRVEVMAWEDRDVRRQSVSIGIGVGVRIHLPSGFVYGVFAALVQVNRLDSAQLVDDGSEKKAKWRMIK